MPDITTLGWRTIVHQLGIERILTDAGAEAVRQDFDITAADEHLFWEVDCRFYSSLTLFISVSQAEGEAWTTLTIGSRTANWGDPVRPTGDELVYVGGASFALTLVREAVTKWIASGTL